jgi:hypothetical protein
MISKILINIILTDDIKATINHCVIQLVFIQQAHLLTFIFLYHDEELSTIIDKYTCIFKLIISFQMSNDKYKDHLLHFNAFYRL